MHELFFDEATLQHIVETTTGQLKHAPFWLYCELVLRWLMRPRIQNNGLPKMLLVSESDAIFHVDEYEKTKAKFPHLKQQLLIQGGHDFFIEHAKVVAQWITTFDEQHGAEPPTDLQQIPDPHFSLKASSRTETLTDRDLER